MNEKKGNEENRERKKTIEYTIKSRQWQCSKINHTHAYTVKNVWYI